MHLHDHTAGFERAEDPGGAWVRNSPEEEVEGGQECYPTRGACLCKEDKGMCSLQHGRLFTLSKAWELEPISREEPSVNSSHHQHC